jgi:hypothetical protein
MPFSAFLMLSRREAPVEARTADMQQRRAG